MSDAIEAMFASARARLHREIERRCDRFLHFRARSEGQRLRRARERAQRGRDGA